MAQAPAAAVSSQAGVAGLLVRFGGVFRLRCV